MCRSAPSISPFFNQPQEILSVFGFEHILHAGAHLIASHPAVFVGDFLQAGDLEPLAGFDRADEVRGIEHAVVRAGVEPGIATLEDLDMKLAAPEVFVVDGCDLKLAAAGRHDVFRDGDDIVVVISAMFGLQVCYLMMDAILEKKLMPLYT